MDKEIAITRVALANVRLMRPNFFKRNPRESAPATIQASLMLESGGFLLLENGGNFLIETQ